MKRFLTIAALAAAAIAAATSCKDKFDTGKPDKPDDTIHPTSISFEEEDICLEFGVNETRQLVVILLPAEATDRRIEWKSSDEKVATVSSQGLVTAVGSGNCDISAKPLDWDGEMIAECHVVVKKKVPAAVDLGLSVKWADINVEADKVGDPGWYFPWGYVYPVTSGPRGDYTYQYGKSTPPNVLSGSSQDAAVKNWGSPWRMPTITEIEELMNNCTWEEETIGGMQCYKVSRNGKSILLPFGGAAGEISLTSVNENGYYWASTLGEEAGITSDKKFAKGWRLRIHSGNKKYTEKWDGWLGQSVRPVQP